jgi:hypothetical protein
VGQRAFGVEGDGPGEALFRFFGLPLGKVAFPQGKKGFDGLGVELDRLLQGGDGRVDLALLEQGQPEVKIAFIIGWEALDNLAEAFRGFVVVPGLELADPAVISSSRPAPNRSLELTESPHPEADPGND